jgi:flavin reductase (DIM6/NTAB) family NADH-FMN oxidoreductase RutF
MSAAPAAVSSSHTDRQLLFRQVMGRFATGVTVVTTCVGEETFGMTANAFMAGSLEPMLCVVSINRAAQMHSRLLQAGHYGVSFLTQLQQHLLRILQVGDSTVSNPNSKFAAAPQF